MTLDRPLTTERLLLRALQTSDASETYLSWMRDPEVNRYLESRFSVPAGVQDLARFIEAVRASPDSLLFGIFLRDGDRHVGNIKMGPMVKTHARTEIGYVIGD